MGEAVLAVLAVWGSCGGFGCCLLVRRGAICIFSEVQDFRPITSEILDFSCPASNSLFLIGDPFSPWPRLAFVPLVSLD